MSLSKPASLGLIACPGAEHLTCEISDNLKDLYLKKNNRKAENLSKKYEVSKEEIIRWLNFTTDLRQPTSSSEGSVLSLPVPNFKIDVEFTRFANGEFKAEILESVRGKDICIIQDVENHHPIRFNNAECCHSLSVNDHVLMLFVTIDAALQASARSVTVVVPAYPFARQHRKKGRKR